MLVTGIIEARWISGIYVEQKDAICGPCNTVVTLASGAESWDKALIVTILFGPEEQKGNIL